MLSSSPVQFVLGDDRADVSFHLIRELSRFLDARGRPGADVQTELPGVHRREEILPDGQQQPRGKQAHGQETEDERPAHVQHAFEPGGVPIAQPGEPGLEPVLEASEKSLGHHVRVMRMVGLVAQKILHQRRHQRAERM